jgi:hypothetical protein
MIKNSLGKTEIIVPGIQNFEDGIRFPTLDGSVASLLKDYKESTFTPEFSYETHTNGVYTYTFQEGKYSKIGNSIYISLLLSFATFAKNADTGAPIITNLPFTAQHTSNNNLYMLTPLLYNWTFTTQPLAFVGHNNNYIKLYRMKSGLPYDVLDDPGATSIIWISGMYQI